MAPVQPVNIKVDIACIYSSTGEFAYSSAVIDRLLTDYIGNNVRVTHSQLTKNSAGNFIINADVFYPQGWGTVAIVPEKIGWKLFITDNTCVHQCIPDPFEPCIYRAIVEEFDPCNSVRCSCSGDGEAVSKVSVGETRGLQRAALTIKNISPACE